MKRCRFTVGARRNLKDIYLHIAQDDPQAALRLVLRIERTCLLLGERPLAGRARPELGPDLRSSAVGSYVVVLRPVQGGVQIMRILHGAQDIEGIFRKG